MLMLFVFRFHVGTVPCCKLLRVLAFIKNKCYSVSYLQIYTRENVIYKNVVVLGD